MVTLGRRAYDALYRIGAPWEGADRVELRALLADGRCSPESLRAAGAPFARAIDLGCGAGSVSLELAEAGFSVVGVDFSPVALARARAAARRRGLGPDRVTFVAGDLTAGWIAGVEGPFDLLVDYGTLDDLSEAGRSAMARYVTSLTRPGSRLFVFGFAGRPEDLPRFSFDGPSRAFPGFIPGEIERRFGTAFRVEVIEAPTRARHLATYLLERRTAAVSGNPAATTPGVDAPWQPIGARTESPLGLRLAARSAIASGAIAAIGIVFLIGMAAAFAQGASSAALVLGRLNDVLVLVSYALAIPSVIALRMLLRPRVGWLIDVVAIVGFAAIASIVVLQLLLIGGALTFEEQVGPVSIALLVLGAWFVAVGRIGSATGILPRGTWMGLIAATYVGYPVWAVWLGRQLRSAGLPDLETRLPAATIGPVTAHPDAG